MTQPTDTTLDDTTSEPHWMVFRELDTAHDENGYPLPSWTAQAIAEDLARHSPALDDRDPEELVPAVQEWLQTRKVRE
jgi:hypothetical protein